jgi:predicted rRNA methylase YqxC with S4 and FtsJ domains
VQKMLSDFLNTLDQSSLYFVQSKNAYIKGKKGNQEIFVHLKRR